MKEWLYRKIFNEEFNLSFGYPRSDTCETCDLLHASVQASKSEEERAELQVELAAHQEKASQGYRLLRMDTEATKTTGDHTLLTFAKSTRTHPHTWFNVQFTTIVVIQLRHP